LAKGNRSRPGRTASANSAERALAIATRDFRKPRRFAHDQDVLVVCGCTGIVLPMSISELIADPPLSGSVSPRRAHNRSTGTPRFGGCR
jgi:hypothetical protein